MESFSYAFEGRKYPLQKWDGESLSVLTNDAVDSMQFVEPILPAITRKPFLINHCLESPCGDTNNNFGKISEVPLNSILEFETRFSGCADDGKLAASSEPNCKRLSSPEPSSALAKRARSSNLPSSVPTCQVHGCNKDLSFSKDYYKRHKVCDVHSKTAVVIVNGIQQRFCQQCSRFHVVAEFDEGKRSCRKRLAGHNQRRRKPQFETFLGSSYLSTGASKTSLLFPRFLSDDYYFSQCSKPIDHSMHLKLEQDPCQIPQHASNMTFDQSLPHPFMKKQSPSNHGHSTPLSVAEACVGSNSSCALSLLSIESHDLVSNPTGMTTPHPLISNENYHYNLYNLQNSAKPTLRQNMSRNFTPMISNPSGINQEGVPLVSDENSPNEISRNSNALNRMSYLSPEDSDTVNLFELSLHLQRVEEQKYSGLVKP